MDFDSFLSSPRWEILKIIAEKPSSPLEISKTINTSVAYVSQQLKLLEAAGFITKYKTGRAEKGKPRTLFRIAREVAYLSMLSYGFSEKKLININEHHKAILKIWFFTDPSLHSEIESVLNELENNIDNISAVYMDVSNIVPKVFVVSGSKSLKSRIDSLTSRINADAKYIFISEKEAERIDDSCVKLYLKEMKGGNDTNG